MTQQEIEQQIAAMKREKELKQRPLANGVYLVAPDGSYEMFTPDAHPVSGTRVGISWDGHWWLIGKDYGELPWTEASEDDLAAETYGIMDVHKAMFDWDVATANNHLRKFFSHIPFAPDEMMPTCPMVLVQENLARFDVLNDALAVCGMPEYKVKDNRWFAARHNVRFARFLYGKHSALCVHGVNIRFRVQAVIPWDI